MPRLLLLVPLALLLTAGPVPAVIKKLTPLKEVLDGEEAIVVATVEKVDPDKPAAVFAVGEALKGKAPAEKLTVNLTGDSFAKKGDPFNDNEPHIKVMLDRLAPGRKLVLFVSRQGAGYSCFGFVEGTWFQFRGTRDGDAVRWAFLHCEPYFRRTFKGTTAELVEVAKESLAGKRKPPEPDEKEPPGYGPKAEKKSAAPAGGPLFAVIPSFLLIGPLAVVAALFPGVFARLAVGMKRWRAFLTVASLNSTLALVYYGLREWNGLPDSPWLSPQAVGCYLLGVTLLGVVWAGRRYRTLAADEPEVTDAPTRKELVTLLGLTAATGGLVLGTGWFVGWAEAVSPAGGTASGIGKEFTAIAVGLTAAALYAGYRAATRRADGEYPVRLSLSGEAVGLGAMVVFAAAVLVATWPREAGPGSLAGEVGEAADTGPRLVESALWFETADFHEALSAVTVTPDRVYFGASKTTGFRTAGAVFCLDRSTGREVWRFDDDGGLKPVYAAPAAANGHVFAGEGLHTDADRRLFRLDAATGRPSWPAPVQTTSHTEGTPRVADGKVYFSAGDDGLYCVAEADGREVWHLKGDENRLHIDTPPAVAGGRVFAGSGYRTWALLALDAATGAEAWRVPVGLRSFGPPLVLGDKVVYGLGTGNLVEDLAEEEQRPAGAVVCVEAATGREVWRFDAPKSVHTRLAADGRTVYAACRDGSVYALNRSTGALRWRRSLGSPLTAGPAVAGFARGAVPVAVYAVSTEGLVACLRPADGAVVWTRDLRAQTGRLVQVFSAPAVEPLDDGLRRQVYVGAMLTNRNSGAKAAAVFRIEDTLGE